MKTLLAAMALTLATGTAAMAFDADTQAIIDSHKRGKPVAITEVAHLMKSAAQWCYDRQDHSCAWSEIYLDVRDDGVTFELANNWDAETNYAFTDEGTFAGNTICQSGFNWIPNLRAARRSDGTMLNGHALHDFKNAVAEARPDIESYSDCFDYLYLSADPEQDTVTLLQRQYVDLTYEPANDVEVTIYFNAHDAAGLTLAE